MQYIFYNLKSRILFIVTIHILYIIFFTPVNYNDLLCLQYCIIMFYQCKIATTFVRNNLISNNKSTRIISRIQSDSSKGHYPLAQSFDVCTDLNDYLHNLLISIFKNVYKTAWWCVVNQVYGLSTCKLDNSCTDIQYFDLLIYSIKYETTWEIMKHSWRKVAIAD